MKPIVYHYEDENNNLLHMDVNKKKQLCISVNGTTLELNKQQANQMYMQMQKYMTRVK